MSSEFRDTYRVERVPVWYSGAAHLALTTTLTLGGALWAVSRVSHPTPAELATVPASFLVANLAEYLGHRFPMHRRWPGLGAVFRRHAGTHHRFFLAGSMTGRDTRDWHVTLFPPVLIVFFLGGIGAPIALVLFQVATANVAWLFVATALAYFLTYEWLHLAWHSRLAATNPLLRRLSAHHRLHHDPQHMGRHNFNITFPIVDRIVGTWSSESPPE